MRKLDANILKRAVLKAGIHDQVQASQSVSLFREAVEKNWGKGALEEIASLYVRGGVLTVKVHNSSLAHEIKISEQRILEHINSKNEWETVERIRFKV